jgi:DnaJ-class molecular chaperone
VQIEDALARLDKDEAIGANQLSSLHLSGASSTILKLRLKGMLSKRKTSLSENIMKQKKGRELLRSLLKCPHCGGEGYTMVNTYDRVDGKVTQTLKSKACEGCGGTGKAKISPNIEEMIVKEMSS